MNGGMECIERYNTISTVNNRLIKWEVDEIGEGSDLSTCIGKPYTERMSSSSKCIWMNTDEKKWSCVVGLGK